MASASLLLRLTALALFMALSVEAASAHIVGAFGDFLAGIEDETTLERLQLQLDETRAEIERLAPEVEALGAEYEQRESAAVAKLLFYKSVWLDTFSSLILESEDLIDLLAGQRLIMHKVAEDIESVNTLYLKLRQLEITRDALVGHEQLLSMIQSNIEARAELFDRYGMLPPDRLARIVTAVWDNSAAAYVDEYLIADAKVVNRAPGDFFTRRTGQSAFVLPQARLNAIDPEKLEEAPEDGTTGQQISGRLTYNIRADHVYVHYVNNDLDQEFVDLILIGQVEREDERHAVLVFEAGFVNGIVLPLEYLEQLGGFKIDYAALNPGSAGFAIDQVGGAILIQPLEGAGE